MLLFLLYIQNSIQREEKEVDSIWYRPHYRSPSKPLMNDVEVLGKRAKQKGGGGEVGEVMLMIVAEERHKS